MTQNNPKAQEQVLTSGAQPVLLRLLRSDDSTGGSSLEFITDLPFTICADVRVKALLAISSLVRHNQQGATCSSSHRNPKPAQIYTLHLTVIFTPPLPLT